MEQQNELMKELKTVAEKGSIGPMSIVSLFQSHPEGWVETYPHDLEGIDCSTWFLSAPEGTECLFDTGVPEDPDEEVPDCHSIHFRRKTDLNWEVTYTTMGM